MRVIKQTRIILEGRIAHMREMRKSCSILGGKSEGNSTFGRLKRK
jgi:hypothetical protein